MKLRLKPQIFARCRVYSVTGNGLFMKKSLVMFLVATLLLAGCTELADSGDGETMKIDVNEDIAIEKIADFMTVDESESFGITMMYDMDPSMMGMDEGMLEVDEDSEAVITIEMTEAWSPDGYHTSSIMGMADGGASMKFVTSMTHIGTTMYIEMGYETQGDLCADEETQEDIEMCEMMFGEMPDVQSYSMTTTTTHTEVIAAMAEETAGNDDDMDPMAMLEFFRFVECSGSFTPVDSMDGLQIFDVTMEGMDDESISASMALCTADTDKSEGISFEEFVVVDETSQEDVDALRTEFDDADNNSDGELTIDELEAFITAVESFYEEDDHDHDHDHDEMGDDDHGDDEPTGMPNMAVAFNSAGEIEYFEMDMEGTTMKMYVLTEEKVDSLFTNVDAGEIVALPFSLTDRMDDDEYDMDNGDTFYCDNGNDIPMDYVNDGDNDCGDNSDENVDRGDDEDDADNGHDHGDEDYEMWTFNREMAECDSDDDGMVDFDELDACVSMDLTNDGYDSDSFEGLRQMFDMVDADEDGLLDSDEFKDFAAMTSGEPMMVCYNMDTHEIDMSINSEADCDAAGLMWTDGDSGDDDHSDDSYIDTVIEEWMASMDSDGDNNITWEEHDAFVSNGEGWESEESRNGSMMLWADYDSDSNGGLDEYELAEYIALIVGDHDVDDEDDTPSPQDLLDGADTDSNGAMTIDEFNAFMDQNGEPFPQEMSEDINMIFDDADTDDSGDLDIDELEQFIMDIDEYIMSMEGSEEMFTCDDGEMIPMDWVNDGMDDCSDGSDETDMGDGHDHGDHGDDHDEMVFYVVNDMDFHFEGDMADYMIDLASCDYDYDMETGEETSTCTTVMSVAMADAGMDSDIMFHDADSSGTISDGDMIHIGDVSEDWDEVRLYSVSADAYSDENPMHNAPGFTGLVGMLALLGAAFIRRNE